MWLLKCRAVSWRDGYAARNTWRSHRGHRLGRSACITAYDILVGTPAPEVVLMLFWALQAQTCKGYKCIPVGKLSYTITRSTLSTEKLSATDTKEKGKTIFLQLCVSEDITHCRIGVVPRSSWPTQSKLHVVFVWLSECLYVCWFFIFVFEFLAFCLF